MTQSLFLEDITSDSFKRFNLITSQGKHAQRFSSTFRYTDNKEHSLEPGAGTRGILVTLKEHILCDSYLSTVIPLNHKEILVPNILYEHKDRWIIFQEVLDIAVPFDKQETFFDDLFKKCRLVNTKLLITTNSIDIIKNFCKSILKTDHDDGVFFQFGESARTSENGKIVATEYTPDEVMDLIDLGIEIR